MKTKTIVFVHSYCLQGADYDKRLRLTGMAKTAMAIGLRKMKEAEAEDIIVSTAYRTWEDEARLQLKHAEKEGVVAGHVHIIPGVKNSYDEALEAARMARVFGASRLIVVAEKWHAKRSLKAFKYACPNLTVEVVPFKTPWYEVSLEPSMIKSVRAGHWFLWVTWNVLLGFVPPKWLGGKQATV